jgi:hypothetical protein
VTLTARDLPENLRARLHGLFGPAVDRVRLVEYSWINALHGWPLAVTRRDRIYLRLSLAEFCADEDLVLHEYFHVLKQWNTGRLTVWRYLREWVRSGYRNNQFEIEARCFAAEHCDRPGRRASA